MYSACGNAKVRGAVLQVEKAHEEGELRLTCAILVNFGIVTCVQRLWDCIDQLHQQKQLTILLSCWLCLAGYIKHQYDSLPLGYLRIFMHY